jgi:DNA topoisomerase IB
MTFLTESPNLRKGDLAEKEKTHKLPRRVSPFRLCGMGEYSAYWACLNAESPTFGRETLRGRSFLRYRKFFFAPRAVNRHERAFLFTNYFSKFAHP